MSRKISLIYCTPLPLPAERELPLGVALRRLAEEPERLAFLDATSGERLTRGELAEQAASLAAGLAAHGIGRGDIVAVTLPNCVWWPVIALGVWSRGAAIAPLHPQARVLVGPGILQAPRIVARDRNGPGARSLESVDLRIPCRWRIQARLR